MKWTKDPVLQLLMERIVIGTEMTHVKTDRVFCVRGEGTKSDALARTWEFPRIFQECLGVEPAYVIEVISKRWDKLPQHEKERVMIHELMHIPKTFSGALVPHNCFGKRVVSERKVNDLYSTYRRFMDECYESAGITQD